MPERGPIRPIVANSSETTQALDGLTNQISLGLERIALKQTLCQKACGLVAERGIVRYTIPLSRPLRSFNTERPKPPRALPPVQIGEDQLVVLTENLRSTRQGSSARLVELQAELYKPEQTLKIYHGNLFDKGVNLAWFSDVSLTDPEVIVPGNTEPSLSILRSIGVILETIEDATVGTYEEEAVIYV